jgi:hypothetical protein
MNLYLLSQDDNTHFEATRSVLVVAPDAETARRVRPDNDTWEEALLEQYNEWVKDPYQIEVELLGEAAADLDMGVILTSRRMPTYIR